MFTRGYMHVLQTIISHPKKFATEMAAFQGKPLVTIVLKNPPCSVPGSVPCGFMIPMAISTLEMDVRVSHFIVKGLVSAIKKGQGNPDDFLTC